MKVPCIYCGHINDLPDEKSHQGGQCCSACGQPIVGDESLFLRANESGVTDEWAAVANDQDSGEWPILDESQDGPLDFGAAWDALADLELDQPEEKTVAQASKEDAAEEVFTSARAIELSTGGLKVSSGAMIESAGAMEGSGQENSDAFEIESLLDDSQDGSADGDSGVFEIDLDHAPQGVSKAFLTAVDFADEKALTAEQKTFDAFARLLQSDSNLTAFDVQVGQIESPLAEIDAHDAVNEALFEGEVATDGMPNRVESQGEEKDPLGIQNMLEAVQESEQAHQDVNYALEIDDHGLFDRLTTGAPGDRRKRKREQQKRTSQGLWAKFKHWMRSEKNPQRITHRPGETVRPVAPNAVYILPTSGAAEVIFDAGEQDFGLEDQTTGLLKQNSDSDEQGNGLVESQLDDIEVIDELSDQIFDRCDQKEESDGQQLKPEIKNALRLLRNAIDDEAMDDHEIDVFDDPDQADESEDRFFDREDVNFDSINETFDQYAKRFDSQDLSGEGKNAQLKSGEKTFDRQDLPEYPKPNTFGFGERTNDHAQDLVVQDDYGYEYPELQADVSDANEIPSVNTLGFDDVQVPLSDVSADLFDVLEDSSEATGGALEAIVTPALGSFGFTESNDAQGEAIGAQVESTSGLFDALEDSSEATGGSLEAIATPALGSFGFTESNDAQGEASGAQIESTSGLFDVLEDSGEATGGSLEAIATPALGSFGFTETNDALLESIETPSVENFGFTQSAWGQEKAQFGLEQAPADRIEWIESQATESFGFVEAPEIQAEATEPQARSTTAPLGVTAVSQCSTSSTRKRFDPLLMEAFAKVESAIDAVDTDGDRAIESFDAFDAVGVAVIESVDGVEPSFGSLDVYDVSGESLFDADIGSFGADEGLPIGAEALIDASYMPEDVFEKELDRFVSDPFLPDENFGFEQPAGKLDERMILAHVETFGFDELEEDVCAQEINKDELSWSGFDITFEGLNESFGLGDRMENPDDCLIEGVIYIDDVEYQQESSLEQEQIELNVLFAREEQNPGERALSFGFDDQSFGQNDHGFGLDDQNEYLIRTFFDAEYVLLNRDEAQIDADEQLFVEQLKNEYLSQADFEPEVQPEDEFDQQLSEEIIECYEEYEDFGFESAEIEDHEELFGFDVDSDPEEDRQFLLELFSDHDPDETFDIAVEQSDAEAETFVAALQSADSEEWAFGFDDIRSASDEALFKTDEQAITERLSTFDTSFASFGFLAAEDTSYEGQLAYFLRAYDAQLEPFGFALLSIDAFDEDFASEIQTFDLSEPAFEFCFERDDAGEEIFNANVRALDSAYEPFGFADSTDDHYIRALTVFLRNLDAEFEPFGFADLPKDADESIFCAELQEFFIKEELFDFVDQTTENDDRAFTAELQTFDLSEETFSFDGLPREFDAELFVQALQTFERFDAPELLEEALPKEVELAFEQSEPQFCFDESTSGADDPAFKEAIQVFDTDDFSFDVAIEHSVEDEKAFTKAIQLFEQFDTFGDIEDASLERADETLSQADAAFELAHDVFETSDLADAVADAHFLNAVSIVLFEISHFGQIDFSVEEDDEAFFWALQSFDFEEPQFGDSEDAAFEGEQALGLVSESFARDESIFGLENVALDATETAFAFKDWTSDADAAVLAALDAALDPAGASFDADFEQPEFHESPLAFALLFDDEEDEEISHPEPLFMLQELFAAHEEQLFDEKDAVFGFVPRIKDPTEPPAAQADQPAAQADQPAAQADQPSMVIELDDIIIEETPAHDDETPAHEDAPPAHEDAASILEEQTASVIELDGEAVEEVSSIEDQTVFDSGADSGIADPTDSLLYERPIQSVESIENKDQTALESEKQPGELDQGLLRIDQPFGPNDQNLINSDQAFGPSDSFAAAKSVDPDGMTENAEASSVAPRVLGEIKPAISVAPDDMSEDAQRKVSLIALASAYELSGPSAQGGIRAPEKAKSNAPIELSCDVSAELAPGCGIEAGDSSSEAEAQAAAQNDAESAQKSTSATPHTQLSYAEYMEIVHKQTRNQSRWAVLALVLALLLAMLVGAFVVFVAFSDRLFGAGDARKAAVRDRFEADDPLWVDEMPLDGEMLRALQAAGGPDVFGQLDREAAAQVAGKDEAALGDLQAQVKNLENRLNARPAQDEKLLARVSGQVDQRIKKLEDALHLTGFTADELLDARLRRSGVAVENFGMGGPFVPADAGYVNPIAGNIKVMSAYGERGDEMHGGVDIAASIGTPVRSVAEGTVIFVQDRAAWRAREKFIEKPDGTRVKSPGWRAGVYLEVQHIDGRISRYMHLDDIAQGIKRGSKVQAGEVIGTVGRTAVEFSDTHLHFELREPGDTARYGAAVNPVAPVAKNAPPVMALAAQRADRDLSEGDEVSQLDARMNRLQMLEDLVRRLPLGMPVSKMQSSSNYGKRRDPMNFQLGIHNGIDLVDEREAPIYAAGPGKVTHAEETGAHGMMVEVDHGEGIVTRYAHLDRIDVRPGRMVESHEKLGEMGDSGRATGVHLHYEVRVDGVAVDPMKFVEAGRAASSL